MKAPDLGKMVGPLPLGGWLGAAGAGLAIAWYLKRKGGTVDAVTASPAQAAIGTDATGLGGAVPLAGSGASSDPSTASPAVPQSNDEWGRDAVNTLIARGFDPIIATGAVNDYLNGVPLDVRETAALALVLQLIGAPPGGTPPLVATPPPASGSGPALGTPARTPAHGNTIVATAYRHDGRGGYAITSAGGLISVKSPTGTMPPAAVWKSASLRATFIPGAHPVSIQLAADDRSGYIMDSKGGRHDFIIAKAHGAAA